MGMLFSFFLLFYWAFFIATDIGFHFAPSSLVGVSSSCFVYIGCIVVLIVHVSVSCKVII
jgi:hypothetical protein